MKQNSCSRIVFEEYHKCTTKITTHCTHILRIKVLVEISCTEEQKMWKAVFEDLNFTGYTEERSDGREQGV